jgi:integrase
MLRAVRNKMIDIGWTRQTINKNIDRIRRMYRWGVEEELVPETLYRALKAVAALSKGHYNVREAPPVKAVGDQLVESTLPHLPGTVADMVRVQRLAGMRPGEICSMRPCDVDRSVNPWRYVPESHKCEHHDQERVIFLGPKAQQILLPYLLRDPVECCFRPVDSESARRAEQHAARKTPIGDGNRPGTNRKRRPKRSAGDRYDVDSYRRAIERGCDRAFPPPAPVARAKGETTVQWRKRLTVTGKQILAEHFRKYRWTPNRLRHAAATKIREQYGSEAAQTVLGHVNLSTTELYAEKDYALAARVAREVG